ncbi:hypothetical protein IPM65_03785 [Candidatus Roizmanbacteria bacterium]|nr:MAG: hypothetical protein IPM65_03785 [Candidatus Roizmanbacteria bacterium]
MSTAELMLPALRQKEVVSKFPALPERDDSVLKLPEQWNAEDFCHSADPYIFPFGNSYVGIFQVDAAPARPEGLSYRFAPSIPAVGSSSDVHLRFENHGDKLLEFWAPEIFQTGNEYHMLVAASNGNNITHRMQHYTSDSLIHSWRWCEEYPTPSWAIDMTYVPEIDALIYSGWENDNDGFPQHIFAMPATKNLHPAGDSVIIGSPIHPYCCRSDEILCGKGLLEGPQALRINNELLGLWVAVSGSWSTDYTQAIMWLKDSDNPFNSQSWVLDREPWFPQGYGIGHGMTLDMGTEDLVYVGHRKTVKTPGWDDRVSFFMNIPKRDLLRRRKDVLG